MFENDDFDIEMCESLDANTSMSPKRPRLFKFTQPKTPQTDPFAEATESGQGNLQMGHTVVKRKFPGPAGLLPNRHNSSFAILEENVENIPQRSEEILYSQTSAAAFSDGPWAEMTKDFKLGHQGGLFLPDKYNVQWIKTRALLNKLVNHKAPFLAAVIQDVGCYFNTMPIMNLILKDLTGSIKATILANLYDEYKSYLTIGSVLVLKQCGVLALSYNSEPCITITHKNIVTIYSASNTEFGGSRTVKLLDVTPSDIIREIEDERRQKGKKAMEDSFLSFFSQDLLDDLKVEGHLANEVESHLTNNYSKFDNSKLSECVDLEQRNELGNKERKYESENLAHGSSDTNRNHLKDSKIYRNQLRESETYIKQLRESETCRNQSRDSETYKHQPRCSEIHRNQFRDSDSFKSQLKDSDSFRSQLRDSGSFRSQLRDSDSFRNLLRDSDSFRSQARDGESYKHKLGNSESDNDQPGASETHRNQLRDSDSFKSQLRDSNSFRSQLRDSDSFRSQPKDSESFRSQLRDSDSFRSQPKDSESFRSQQRDSDSFRSRLRDSESFRSQLRDSGSFRIHLRDSDSFRIHLRGSDSFRSQSRGDESYKSQLGNSESDNHQPGASETHRNQLEDSNSFKSQLSNSNSFRSQLRDSDSFRSQLRDRDSFRRQMRDSDSFRSQLIDSDSFRSQLSESDSFRSQSREDESYKPQLGNSESYNYQLGDSETHRNQLGDSDNFRSELRNNETFKHQSRDGETHRNQSRDTESHINQSGSNIPLRNQPQINRNRFISNKTYDQRISRSFQEKSDSNCKRLDPICTKTLRDIKQDKITNFGNSCNQPRNIFDESPDENLEYLFNLSQEINQVSPKSARLEPGIKSAVHSRMKTKSDLETKSNERVKADVAERMRDVFKIFRHTNKENVIENNPEKGLKSDNFVVNCSQVSVIADNEHHEEIWKSALDGIDSSQLFEEF